MIIIHDNQPKTVFESKGFLYCPCCKSDFRQHENGERTVFSCGNVLQEDRMYQTKKCSERQEKMFYFNQYIESMEESIRQLVETNNSFQNQLEGSRTVPKIESGRFSVENKYTDFEEELYEDETDLEEEYEDEDAG